MNCMAEIKLNHGMVALIDDEDFDMVNGLHWGAVRRGKSWYAAANGGLYMHRLIMPGHARVDHINRNGLDNRRSNLRAATKAQNAINAEKPSGVNTSRFKGVSLVIPRPWRAALVVDQKQIDLGLHATEEQAARAYDAAAKTHFGEFAFLNFPGDE